jgi:hypothetical protein
MSKENIADHTKQAQDDASSIQKTLETQGSRTALSEVEHDLKNHKKDPSYQAELTKQLTEKHDDKAAVLPSLQIAFIDEHMKDYTNGGVTVDKGAVTKIAEAAQKSAKDDPFTAAMTDAISTNYDGIQKMIDVDKQGISRADTFQSLAGENHDKMVQQEKKQVEEQAKAKTDKEESDTKDHNAARVKALMSDGGKLFHSIDKNGDGITMPELEGFLDAAKSKDKNAINSGFSKEQIGVVQDLADKWHNNADGTANIAQHHTLLRDKITEQSMANGMGYGNDELGVMKLKQDWDKSYKPFVGPEQPKTPEDIAKENKAQDEQLQQKAEAAQKKAGEERRTYEGLHQHEQKLNGTQPGDGSANSGTNQLAETLKPKNGEGYYQIAERLLKQTGHEHADFLTVKRVTEALKSANLDEHGKPRTALKGGVTLNVPENLAQVLSV